MSNNSKNRIIKIVNGKEDVKTITVDGVFYIANIIQLVKLILTSKAMKIFISMRKKFLYTEQAVDIT